MTFDIHQKIFDADGLPLEGVARAYQDELLNLFEQSPERQALREEGFGGHWAGILLDLGQNYLGVTPPKMSAKDLRDILFDLFHSKYQLSLSKLLRSLASCTLFGASCNVSST